MNEQKKLIDEAFYINQSPWGTWNSYDKEGETLVTSLTEDSVISATRYLLKRRQES